MSAWFNNLRRQLHRGADCWALQTWVYRRFFVLESPESCLCGRRSTISIRKWRTQAKMLSIWFITEKNNAQLLAPVAQIVEPCRHRLNDVFSLLSQQSHAFLAIRTLFAPRYEECEMKVVHYEAKHAKNDTQQFARAALLINTPHPELLNRELFRATSTFRCQKHAD